MSKARVVTFHYTLTNDAGEVLDTSRERNDPMTYMEGTGQIIPGLDSAIQKLGKGDKKVVKVKAADAYGDKQGEMIIEVKHDQFPKDAKITVGDRFRANAEDGQSPVFTVVGVTDTHVKVDGNHPLAGVDLTFDVEITDARDATAEEIAHGHAHGPGGHHHH